MCENDRDPKGNQWLVPEHAHTPQRLSRDLVARGLPPRAPQQQAKLGGNVVGKLLVAVCRQHLALAVLRHHQRALWQQRQRGENMTSDVQ